MSRLRLGAGSYLLTTTFNDNGVVVHQLEKIGEQLYRAKAAENVVSNSRIELWPRIG
jgi:hypothetical protein